MKKAFSHFIILLVALQVLNLGMQAQDLPTPISSTGHQALNVTESVSEYLVEVIMGYTGAIPEIHYQHKLPGIHKHCSFKAIEIQPSLSISVWDDSEKTLAKSRLLVYNYLFYQEITPPPPRV